MDFQSNEAIFLQIADFMTEQILLSQWKPLDRIPSVREMASQLQVNPNTVMRAYEHLHQQGVLYNKRGVGFFVEDGSVETIKENQKTHFLNKELPALFKRLHLLQITEPQLSELYRTFINDYNLDNENK
jgi:GntR family transcriptional regulator